MARRRPSRSFLRRLTRRLVCRMRGVDGEDERGGQSGVEDSVRYRSKEGRRCKVPYDNQVEEKGLSSNTE